MQDVIINRYGLRDVILLILGNSDIPLIETQIHYEMKHYELKFNPTMQKISGILSKLARRRLIYYEKMKNTYGIQLTKTGINEYNSII